MFSVLFFTFRNTNKMLRFFMLRRYILRIIRNTKPWARAFVKLLIISGFVFCFKTPLNYLKLVQITFSKVQEN